MTLFVQARLESSNEHGFQNSSDSQLVDSCGDFSIKIVIWILSEVRCGL